MNAIIIRLAVKYLEKPLEFLLKGDQSKIHDIQMRNLNFHL